MRAWTSAMLMLLLCCIDKAVDTFTLKSCSRFGWLAAILTGGGSEGKRSDGYSCSSSLNPRWGAPAAADDRGWKAHHQGMTTSRLAGTEDSSASEALSHHNLTITIVTGNMRKRNEVMAILGEGLPYKFVHSNIDLPELQGEPEEVALEKCRVASRTVCGPVLVDDTSLGFNALKGLPGVYIKWFFEKLGYEGLNDLLAAHADKSAVAQSTCAFSLGPAHDPVLFVGRANGTIVPARGPLGFGWDAIFQPDGYSVTYAEMAGEVKNDISHRYKSVSLLKEYLVGLEFSGAGNGSQQEHRGRATEAVPGAGAAGREKQRTIIEASTRLDAVASGALGLSRSRLVKMIAAGEVTVNGAVSTSGSTSIRTGCEIVLQSGSRVWVDGIGLTSRGKYRVDVRIVTSDGRKAGDRQQQQQ